MVVDVCIPWHYKKIMKPVLETILDELGKSAPDIVVATHYDSDHIGGLIPLIEDYIEDIKEVWVHRSPELYEEEMTLIESFDRMENDKSYNQFVFESRIIDQFSSIKEEAIREKSSFVIESIRQLRTFIGLIPADKERHFYHGYELEDWPEI